MKNVIANLRDPSMNSTQTSKKLDKVIDDIGAKTTGKFLECLTSDYAAGHSIYFCVLGICNSFVFLSLTLQFEATLTLCDSVCRSGVRIVNTSIRTCILMICAALNHTQCVQCALLTLALSCRSVCTVIVHRTFQRLSLSLARFARLPDCAIDSSHMF